jgi:peptidoglycan-associated lipoprotein
MNSRHTALGSLVLSVAAVSLLVACAESKPASAGASSPVGASKTTAPSNVQPAQVPTTGTVAISEEVRRACGISDEDAYFAFDSSTILSVDITPLNAVARCFTVGPLKGRSLRLVGHADPRGSSEYNMTLGQGRADSVQGYLGRHGVSHSQLGTSSRGAMDASGTSESGWAHDRRVDVMLGS